ncbi:toll/interleukin-1 receptor domain-containing protein [candidate division KSB1 bacterium]|nr:toll/interleukin-1 receptor domain-containing protein [candidate division KSB1 bacterium]
MKKLFEFPYRDRLYKKYNIEVYLTREEPEFDGKQFQVNLIRLSGELVKEIKIEIVATWLLGRQILTSGNQSPMLQNVILDFLYGKKIDELPDNEVISFHANSSYASSVFENEKNNILNYRRNLTIAASENKFIRELMLHELYAAEVQEGNQDLEKFKRRCHFNDLALSTAVKVLIDQNFVEYSHDRYIRLKHSGSLFVENNFILSPYRNTIFLIAACQDDIYRLIDLVYKPIVEDQLGYELKFQEKSEPKGTIHDDMWESIEQSKLILCDFSHQSPNCFIEYGYALRCRKHIILIIEEGEGKKKDGSLNTPFDTLTQKYSFWQRKWLTQNNHENEIEMFKAEIKERIIRKIALMESESII